MKSEKSKSTAKPASQSTKSGGQKSEEEIVALINRMAEKHTLRRLPDGSILRFFYGVAFLQSFDRYKYVYNVQIIFNNGVRDRRLMKHKLERRIILFQSIDREDAVEYFNEKLSSYFATHEPTEAERTKEQS